MRSLLITLIFSILALNSARAATVSTIEPAIVDPCQKLLRDSPPAVRPRKPTPKELVREQLAKVEPMLELNGSKVTLNWEGVEKELLKFARNKGENESDLSDLTVNIYRNGRWAWRGPFGTTSVTMDANLRVQEDFYVAFKRGNEIVHLSSFGHREINDGQVLEPGCFTGRYAGELLGVELSEGLEKHAPSPELMKSAVNLSYKKIVWVISPNALQSATARFINHAKKGVKVRAIFGEKGEPEFVEVEDRETGQVLHSRPEDFIFKLDAAFNGNSFFWDDMLVALATIPHHPWLVRSTIRFWLMVQQNAGKVIPREVRKSNFESLFWPFAVNYGEDKRWNLVYTNPYLMNWVMDELYRFDPSPENERLLREVLTSVEDYAHWLEEFRSVRDSSGKIVGFNGSALGAGADNRSGRLGNRSEPDAQNSGLMDIMAQQIQMYKDLAKWSDLLIKKSSDNRDRQRLRFNAEEAKAKIAEYTETMNQLYWNPERCFYFDLIPNGPGAWKQNLKYTVIGGFWPLWAGVPNEQQVKCMIDKQLRPDAFGGDFPFPANARYSIKPGEHTGDPLYAPRPFWEEDGYWDKWAHWPPMAMVVVEGLRRAGHLDLAYEYSVRFLQKIAKWSTKTVEESYGEFQVTLPDGRIVTEARAIQHSEHTHRTDFAGWGKGPAVYMYLKHVLGLVPDHHGRMNWNLMVPMEIGQEITIKNLQYKGGTVHLLKLRKTGADSYDLIAKSDKPFPLILNIMRDRQGKLHNTPVKVQVFQVRGE